MVVAYLQLTLSFFVTLFFIDFFWRFYRTKTVVQRKVFTYKKGGLFERYYIVIVLIGISYLMDFLGYSPFLLDNMFGLIVQSIMFFISLTVFLIFTVVLLGYVTLYAYVRIKRIENMDARLNPYIYRIVLAVLMTALLFSLVITVIVQMAR